MKNTPFLKAVAEDIYRRIGNDMSRTVVIFPGKRAGLFFNQYLADCSSHPLWAPSYVTISELFGKLSSLQVESPIRQVCRLHSIFNAHTHRNESLDDFYYWGELLLSDFDDIDKNMVDTDNLFVNLADIKAINSRFDFLTEEQKDVIERFFGNFSSDTHPTLLKEQFLELWQVMGPIYHELRHQLKTAGLAYEGMMYREVIEQFTPSSLTYEHYIVVGFNVLNRVEQALFEELHKSGKALFYWDYDHYYLDNPKHEAGVFLRDNIAQFGNALKDSPIYNNLAHLPQITCIAAPTDNAQSRYLYNWLNKFHTRSTEQETAIVLCNEDIALSALHALPPEVVSNVNVTMGFKLTQTPIYNLVNSYLTLHTRGYDEDRKNFLTDAVTDLLSHPYIERCFADADKWKQELLKANRLYLPYEELSAHPLMGYLFTLPDDNNQLLHNLIQLIETVGRIFFHKSDEEDRYMQLYQESLFRCHQQIESLRFMIADGTLKIKPGTLIRLIQRVLKQTTIPFHGEPAIGLQVMGVLETRNLDFRHIILLSTNEGKLPKRSNESSFIPHNLREAFGMTTLQRQDSVYAYYFYRAIQRAEHVTLVYNDGTDGLNRQEPSRFIMQLKVEFPGVVTQAHMMVDAQPILHRDISLAQTSQSIRKLQAHFGNHSSQQKSYRLSPSAINDYLDCRLRFYLKHIEGLTPPQEVHPNIDVAEFGTLFHKSAELAYKKLTERGSTIHAYELEALYKNKIAIEGLIDEAFRTEVFHITPEEPLPYNGTQLIARHALSRYLCQLLRIDAKRAPFKYIGSEIEIRCPLTIQSHGRTLTIQLGGTIDRMDSKEGITRIIDYKTGGKQKTISSVSDLFNREIPRDGYVFQAFYYAHLLQHEHQRIVPSLLFIKNTTKEDFEPNIIINREAVTDYNTYHEDFSRLLIDTIEEIFNSDIPYTAASNIAACKYCKFTSLCRRKVNNFDK